MKNIEFTEKAKSAALNYHTIYVMGCFGAPLTGGNIARYTNNHPYNKRPERTAMILDKADQDYFGFDCICFIKGLLWGWKGDIHQNYGGAVYASNGVMDVDPQGMLNLCSGVSDDFSSVTPGEYLWLQGHCGIYLGDGLAAECTPAWDNKVQITAVGNIAARNGYHMRNWVKHGKLPFVDYEPAAGTSNEQNAGIKSGDLVRIDNDAVYYGGQTMPSWVKDQKWYVKSVEGDYAVIDENENHSNSICSPVNICYLHTEGKSSQAENWVPSVGDSVFYQGYVHYAGANERGFITCKGGPAVITQIYALGKSLHPYHLVRKEGGGATVYGWVDAKSFTKL